MDFSHRPVTGIIPARAGFTPFTLNCKPVYTDHPRSRGVYAAFVIETEPGRGSSPLARGLRKEPIMAANDFRIIPARAGFTGRSRLRFGGLADHPRSRGVYAMSTASS